MKPSVWQTGFAFALVGAVTAFLGFAGIPNPLTIGSGVVAVLIGLGLLTRLRQAWWAGLVYTVVQLAFIAFRVYRGLSGPSLVMPLVWGGLYAYLLVSLLFIRAHFAPRSR